ncbi:MAG: hypothetical protein SGILL_002826 [Bacillariaceae sp.]
MRASAIGLRHQYTPPNAAKKKQQQQQQGQQSVVAAASITTPIIVHLLDSPGHTDFSTEVSSSLQCCDGCLLVVDAVEGMCARTHQVAREAHSHQLVPILVINKVDRLCTNLCLTPTEAYLRLRSLLESVNAACAAMLVSKRAEDDEQQRQNGAEETDATKAARQKEQEAEEARWTFDPQQGNVIFASALFGWGFTVPALSRSLFRNKKLPIKPVMLKQYLFGDFYYKQDPSANDENGKLMKWKGDGAQQPPPLFAEYALQPIWDMYEGISSAAVVSGIGSTLFADGRVGSSGDNNTNGIISNSKILATTPGMDEVLCAMQVGNTSAPASSIKTKDDIQQVLTRTGSGSSEEAVLRSLLRRFRPLSDCVLDSVYEICPSPVQAAEEVRPRALALAKPDFHGDVQFSGKINEEQKQEFATIQGSVRTCDVSNKAHVVAYVCKFMATDRAQIRDPSYVEGPNDPSTVILGLARVLSGKLKSGERYTVFSPKHKFRDNRTMEESVLPVKLFLLMGSSFVLVDEVPAGHLCAIQNLEDLQYKTATLCDSQNCMPLLGFADGGVRPLVKVNVEAVDAADTRTLEIGLVRLSRADGAVEVSATEKGERILACLGELHLEQSILDLKKIYCGREIGLRISEPIVEFGETTAWFGDNELDFQGFLSDANKKSPPLRQLTIPPYNEEEGIEHTDRGRARSIISGRLGAISLRAVPFDPLIFQSIKQGSLIEGSAESIGQLKRALGFPKDLSDEAVLEALCASIISTDDNGNAIVSTPTLERGNTVSGVRGDEIFVKKTSNVDESVEGDELCGESEYVSLENAIRDAGFSSENTDGDLESHALRDTALHVWKNQMKGSVVAGFQMAMRHGPVCEEPVRHVLIVLEGLEVALKEDAEAGYKTPSPLSGGMIAAALRIGIRSALLYVKLLLCSMRAPMSLPHTFFVPIPLHRSRPVRLVESHLKLTLNSSLNGLGPLYNVLSRRRGKVLEDSMVDGTDLLLISATLPHAESFGLAPELFRVSSGEVTAPELIFSHWEISDQDPFWIPSTLEEREDFGEILQSGDVSTGIDNTALNYIRKVRKRKGLLVDSSRTVVAAEKQRTIKK